MNDQSGGMLDMRESPVPAGGKGPAKSPPVPVFSLAPMHGKATLIEVLDALLKSPGEVLFEIRQSAGKPVSRYLVLMTVAGMVVFGFINGTFSGGEQLIWASLKFPIGLILTGLICWPSMYLFSAMAGANISIRESFGMLLMLLGLSTAVLVGFAPVVWVFSQSTNSVSFMGGMNLVFWLVGSCIGFRVLRNGVEALSTRKQSVLWIWYVVFLLVSFQMTTTLRPLIGISDSPLSAEKVSFLQHWSSVMSK